MRQSLLSLSCTNCECLRGHRTFYLHLVVPVLVLCPGLLRAALFVLRALPAHLCLWTIQVRVFPFIYDRSLIATRTVVVVRTQMSTLKHSIRHQQAQLHNLENIMLRGPRPLPPGMLSSPPRSPDLDMSSPPPSYVHNTPSTKMQRRSSFDVLHGLAGPESNLPLPKRDGVKEDGSIREGVPMNFGVNGLGSNSYKRVSSPTRTLSRGLSLQTIIVLAYEFSMV